MDEGKSNGKQNFFNMKVFCSPPIIVHPAGDIQAGGTYFLSNLDQNIPVIMKTIYCFPATEPRSTDKIGEILRASLEKVLSHFYPFDGRFAVDDEKKLVVRLNGGGVPFIEATTDCRLDELGDISIPQPEKLGKLVYCPQAESIFEMPLLMVQVTIFKCGGFVVGMAMSHSLADGLSTVEFLHAWAETARGLPISVPPFLDRSLLAARRPPKPQFPIPEFTDLSGSLSTVPAASPFPSLPILHKSFSFDPAKLSRLKILATDAGDDRPPPSTFAALAGLVWRSRTKALNTPSADPAKLLFAVDGRKRLKPPLPGGFFGNGIKFACCLCPAGELVDRPLAHTVRMVQSAIWEVSDESIRSTIDYYEVTRAIPSLAGTLVLTDWTRLGFGATDFGWGCAAQTGPAELPGMEVALFLPPGKGAKTGITVVLGLSAPAMRTFEEMMDF